MNILELTLRREIFDVEFTLGRLYVAGSYYCYVGEDADRELEIHPENKIHGQTAIPRGRYQVSTSFSSRFGRVMPIILGVRNYSGVRFHGGNGPEDSLGCPMLGTQRTPRGVANCKEINKRLLKLIQDTEAKGDQVWVTVE